MSLALFRLVPAWAWALLLALSYGGWQHSRAAKAGAQALAAERDLSTLRADAAQRAIDTLAKTVVVQQGAVREAQQSAVVHQAAAASAADAFDRLRNRASRPGAGCPAPAVADGSASAPGGSVVSADLFSEVGQLTRRYAAIADDRGRAGTACERIEVGR